MATDAPPEKHRDAGVDPPDGGARAWLVMLASFMCNGLLFGVINTYSVVYVNLHKKLEEEGVAEASSKACEYLGRRSCVGLSRWIRYVHDRQLRIINDNVPSLESCWVAILLLHQSSDVDNYYTLVGSLAIGTTFFLSPVAGILTDKIGIRTTTFIGGLLASGGMLLSSLCTRVSSRAPSCGGTGVSSRAPSCGGTGSSTLDHATTEAGLES
uniref:Uncharacterized protein n=1 Tax=Timema genevievae TaxID=629358 RepID=A0A7R9K1K3_TIMGE|nr:unnamed protein product [Timema genevievae]